MISRLRYPADALKDFASRLLAAAGMDAALAATVAMTLVEGDLLGHDTHGLALLAPYIDQISNGALSVSGAPETLDDHGAVVLWDGKRLPGPWLVHEGLRQMKPRARQFGSATLVIRNSHHIACLAAYLREPSEEGFLTVLSSSDPTVQIVAPHGGTRAVFTPNPIAAGIPAHPTPWLIDISASMTTNGMVNRLHRAGQTFDEPFLLDAEGHPSVDPGVMKADPSGTLLPLGGLRLGHKGFGLALLIEALTSGLAGHGRAAAEVQAQASASTPGQAPAQAQVQAQAQAPGQGWGASVNLMLFDTRRFGGEQAFLQETTFLADACRRNPPRP
ncbi:Ldh family oxidoreductase, partial [Castellaniella sp.]|uniref:Ldh family oxidoreductase n=1 Tax=Castellaniella sp. TaxID=1955812 RepID=UPI0035639D23